MKQTSDQPLQLASAVLRTLVDFLEAERTERGLSESDFAGLLQMRPAAYEAWLQGETFPDLQTIIQIGVYLEWTEERIFNIFASPDHLTGHTKGTHLAN